MLTPKLFSIVFCWGMGGDGKFGNTILLMASKLMCFVIVFQGDKWQIKVVILPISPKIYTLLLEQ